MRALDLNTVALCGTHLIEASAGTGKTFTLAHLYLRLIAERGLAVEQVLVVTFTNAAVQELRLRLRKILFDARAALDAGGQGDALLVGLLDRARAAIAGQGERDPAGALLRRIELARLSMDQAAIFTIHGFCQRVLADNAFDSAQLFSLRLIDSDRALREQAVQGWWRERYAALCAARAALVARELGSPEQLLERLEPLLGPAPPRVLPEVGPGTAERELAAAEQAWARFAAHWRSSGEAMRALLVGNPALNGNKVRAGSVDKVAQWFDARVGEPGLPLGPDGQRMDLFTPSFLATATKKGGEAPRHPGFEACEDWLAAVDGLPARFAAGEMQAARDGVAQRLAAIKRERAEMGFDDLLHYVAQAFSGPAGPLLAERLRGEYPLALIDEFQDTDAVQYGIFAAIYPRGLTHNGDEQALGLYLIGDPKQAIYRFRGADIHTYLGAAAFCDNKHTLATNFRSSDAVVETVNALFEAADAPFGMGGELPFEPVRASGKIAPLCDAAGRAQAPLRLLLHGGDEGGKALKSGDANPWAARACAALISDQLRAGRRGELSIDGEPLQAGQLAVLVRTNAQARAVASQLRALAIPSVVGVRESVFASAEALDMQHWLALMQQPGDERALRRVLASPLGGVGAAVLAAHEAGDGHWLEHRQHVAEAARLFRRAGPLAALMRQLGDWRCAARLGGRPGGERALTNYLQLGELLQGAAAEQRGFDGLISWYQRLMAEPVGGGEAARQRLETDSKLVQIVTQHASKGLEYPLVYLPFLNPPQDKTGQRDRLPVLCQSAAGPVADFGGEDFDEHVARARAEEAEERMRLFYVALTRASRQLTLIGGHIRESERSALAALLGADGPGDNLAQRLRAWAGARAGVQLLGEPEAVALPPLDEASVSVARTDALSPVPGWAMSSYTALVRDAHGGHAAEEPDHDGAAAGDPAEGPAVGPVDEVFAFPRGAQAGTCLHELFEQLDFAACDAAAVSAQVQSSLAGHGFPARWAPAIEQLVENTLDTALAPVPGLSLRRIGAADRLVEMGFHCPLEALSAAPLNALLREHAFFADAGALDFATVRGYLKGFVDLIFRFEGRWYICDYKSNHLGDRVSDYRAPALRAAMASHHYGLQYLLYTVALHRYLQRRLPDYDYERHMGGCFYLFLRGLRAGEPESPGVYFDRPPRALVEALDALLAGTVA